MADLRKVTLTIEVVMAEAMKNLHSIKTQFQGLDKMGTKTLTSGVNESTKSLKHLDAQLKSSEIRGWSAQLVKAEQDLKSLGYAGVQSGGMVVNSMAKAKNSLTGFFKGLGGTGGFLGAVGVGAILGSTLHAGAYAQINKQGAMQVAAQRNWSEKELANLEASLNQRNDLVSKSDIYLFAQRNASFAENTAEISTSLENETGFFKNNMGRLKDMGINNVMDLDEAIKSGNAKVLEGIIVPGEITSDVMEKARAAALRESGGYTEAGFSEALDKFTTYYQYQEAIAKTTGKVSTESSSAAESIMKFNAAMSNLQLNAGEKLLPTFTRFLDTMTEVVNFLGPSRMEILAMGAGILTAVVAVGYLIGPLTAVITLLKAVVMLLSANPLGILIIGLAIVLPLIYAWADKMGYIKKAMDWLNTLKIGEKLSSIGEFALKVLIPKAEFLSPLLAILKLSWSSLEMIGAVLVKIFDLWRNFVGWELTVLRGITDRIQAFSTHIKTEFVDLKNAILSVPEKIVTAITSIKDALFNLLGIETPEAAKSRQEELYKKAIAEGFSEREAHQIAHPEDKYFYKPGETPRPLSELGITEEEAKKQGMLQSIIAFNDQQERRIARLKGEKSPGGPTSLKPVAEKANRFFKPIQNVVTETIGPVNQYVHQKAEALQKQPGLLGSIVRSDTAVVESISMDTGGYIKSEGFLKLHGGERVLNESDVQRGSAPGGNVTVNLTVNNPLFTNSAEMYKFDQHIRDVINRENLCHMTNKRGRGMIA